MLSVKWQQFCLCLMCWLWAAVKYCHNLNRKAIITHQWKAISKDDDDHTNISNFSVVSSNANAFENHCVFFKMADTSREFSLLEITNNSINFWLPKSAMMLSTTHCIGITGVVNRVVYANFTTTEHLLTKLGEILILTHEGLEKHMDNFVYVPSQWEMTLQCNIISHWVSTSTEWFQQTCTNIIAIFSGIILCMHPANERQHCNVTSSLIGWAHAQNDPWFC